MEKIPFDYDNAFVLLEMVDKNDLLVRNLKGINILTPSNMSYLNNNLDYKLHFLWNMYKIGPNFLPWKVISKQSKRFFLNHTFDNKMV